MDFYELVRGPVGLGGIGHFHCGLPFSVYFNIRCG